VANAVWKGHLTFGLITIPARLFVAARTERISFHQLHSVCHSRLRMPLYCPVCKRMVERSEVIKGYEYEKDQYVLVTEDEIEKIAPPSAHVLEIQEFVKTEEVDPLYLDASYYLLPEDAGRKAYLLLTKTMEQEGFSAVTKLSMHQREYTTLLRPRAGGLTLHTLFYADEVRQLPEYGKTDSIELKPQEVKLAQQLISSLAGKFTPEDYKDEYQERVKQLIEAKRQGQAVAEAPAPQPAPVIDLMEALKKSLAGRQAVAKKPPARAVEAETRRPRKKSAG
jgi:DNA end-binding protein Ku